MVCVQPLESTGPLEFICRYKSRDDYISIIPEAERGDMVVAYHAQLNSADDETRIKAAKAWSRWE